MNISEFKKIKQKKPKYNNKKVGGYDSKKEKERADILKVMQKMGYITNLQEQVKYVLIPCQYEEKIINGKIKKVCVEKEVSYKADFVYKDSKGNLIVEDTKGFRTKDYIIKRKLMLQVHGIKIRET